MKVFLVGLPGSGKSTLGKQLSEKLEVPFIDLDDVIEDEAKQPIRKIFAQRGEDAFRKLEQKALKHVIDHHATFVMATGGGAPCFFDNMEQMKQSGTTIFTNTPISLITDRMKKEGVEVRPLLHELDNNYFSEVFHQKFAYRLPYYRQADLTITPSDELDQIAQLLKLKTQRK